MMESQASSRHIDLRSDLLAPPTAEMRAAIAESLCDPAHFGLREDPRQRGAERAIAGLLGKEDALLFPTCTMANQTALALLTRPGETVLAQPDAHILTSESGAAAAISGVQIISSGGDVAPDAPTWCAAIVESLGVQQPRISVLSIENTHNRSGGRVLSPAQLAPVLSLTREYGLRAHLDGARLFNAAVALDVAPAALASGFDTVSLSLNKGLGAPFGAALAASGEVLGAALHIRQRLGGGMRRMGPLAAAATVALKGYSHIRDDHRRARLLAEKLVRLSAVRCVSENIDSNIVLLDIIDEGWSAARLSDALAARGVLVLVIATHRIRMTTHRGISDADIAGTVDAIRDTLDAGPVSRTVPSP